MKIGVPTEIKPQENRIGLTPESAKVLISNGHEVLVENDGGFEAGFENEQYKSAGAKIVDRAEDKLWKKASGYRVDEKSFFISYLFLIGFVIVTIGSTASLYAFNIPEIAKDGLRVTTLISLLGIVGVVLHLGFKKILGED